MPINIQRFEQLAILALAISAITIVIKLIPLSMNASGPFVLAAFATGLLPTVGLSGLLVWFASRRRQNWARWALLIVTVAGIPLTVMNMATLLRTEPLTATAGWVSTLCIGAALYFAFTGDAPRWFSSASSEADQVPRQHS